MGELVKADSDIEKIDTHSFDAAKKALKEFSEQTPDKIKLPTVKTENEHLFGLFSTNHNVTGSELNNLTQSIQNYLINLSNGHLKFIKEFGEVYNALEALDKEYISAILLALKNTEKNHENIKEAQKEIRNTLAIQVKSLEKFVGFKKRIESSKHLYEIDELWNNQEKNENTIVSIAADCKNYANEISKLGTDLKKLIEFQKNVESNKHLYDIDLLWDEQQNLKKKSTDLEQKLLSLFEEIENISRLNESFNKEISNINIHLNELNAKNESAEQQIQGLKDENLGLKSNIQEVNVKNETLEQQIQKLIKTNLSLQESLNKNIDFSSALQKQIDESKQANELLSQNLQKVNCFAYTGIGIAIVALILGVVIKFNG